MRWLRWSWWMRWSSARWPVVGLVVVVAVAVVVMPVVAEVKIG